MGGYGYWGTRRERIVYRDEDFVIVRHTARGGGYVYEVIPVTADGKRLDDWQICPEVDALDKAMELMRKHRAAVRRYKQGMAVFRGFGWDAIGAVLYVLYAPTLSPAAVEAAGAASGSAA